MHALGANGAFQDFVVLREASGQDTDDEADVNLGPALGAPVSLLFLGAFVSAASFSRTMMHPSVVARHGRSAGRQIDAHLSGSSPQRPSQQDCRLLVRSVQVDLEFTESTISIRTPAL
jgi:hypothetical protein